MELASSMDKVIVFVSGLASITFIAWFFFGKKDSSNAVLVDDAVTIEVKGGYNPSSIQIRKGKKTTITFHRTDPSSCLEEVVLPDFKIRSFLPLNKSVSITLMPSKVGEFAFSCGMHMFHGKLIVKE